MTATPRRWPDNPTPSVRVNKRHGDATQRLWDRSAAIKSLDRFVALLAVTAGVAGAVIVAAPIARSAPSPEIEYLYDVEARRQFAFPANTDPVSYGHAICDKVGSGEGYAQLITDIRGDVQPSDEPAANYLLSYAVNLLCPERIPDLRHSAAGYQPPAP